MKEYTTLCNDKFKEIRTRIFTTKIRPKEILNIKSKSHKFFGKWPKLSLAKNKNKNKNLRISEENYQKLEQIEDDKIIQNDDKLLTDIKIDFTNKNNNDDRSNGSMQTTKTHNSNIAPKRIYRPKKSKEFSKKIFNTKTLELNCNKLMRNQRSGLKKENLSTQTAKKSKIHNNRNIEQFINKPSKTKKMESLLMTPMSNKNKISIKKNRLHKNNSIFHTSQNSFDYIRNYNDSMSISSTSRIPTQTNHFRGHSLPPSKNRKSNMNLPNRTTLKQHSKLIFELQKIFGDTIQLSDDLYNQMTEYDKKFIIIFLLDSVKELNNLDKINKSKIEAFRQLNDTKDKQIKKYKNENKDIKKEVVKLNKIIKSNSQAQKKLEQNVEHLKIQLEMEKIKFKNIQEQLTYNNSYMKQKLKNDKSVEFRKKHSKNSSIDSVKKVNGLINKKKFVNKNIKNKIKKQIDEKKNFSPNKENNMSNYEKDNSNEDKKNKDIKNILDEDKLEQIENLEENQGGENN